MSSEKSSHNFNWKELRKAMLPLAGHWIRLDPLTKGILTVTEEEVILRKYVNAIIKEAQKELLEKIRIMYNANAEDYEDFGELLDWFEKEVLNK